MKPKTPRATRKSLHTQLSTIIDEVTHTSLDESIQRTIVDHLNQAQVMLAKGKPINPFTPLPLTVEQAKQMKDKDGFVTVVMPLSLTALSKNGDYRDELVSEKIGGEERGFCLEELSYRLLGGSGQNAIVEVTCNVNHWLDVYEAV